MSREEKIRTYAFFAGMLLLSGGAALYSLTAGLCTAGCILIAVAILGELRSK